MIDWETAATHLAVIVKANGEALEEACREEATKSGGEPRFTVDGCVTCVLRPFREEIERLEAIVGKLHKTADGVPITPGMVLYRIVDAQTIEPIRVHTVTETVVETYSNRIRQAFVGSELYATREAAEAAKEKQ